ncbi:hypothetical protein DDB_G0288657 [Dictyostelium discoideum AX4]|uniref:Putative uncharacterized protein DDB_G0288657 n=1 Tax=Dictyostelium discoideum TaxID=44689 RepID=Y8038_DICDI|nr:hypothetical protein DDB_G0288657 [Dictyostelium discoideum AX4]Q54IM4.1 RecName: Full=Putative uncharacterized protein DDB_G0288657 [Dictyostelium discoideum]EAL63105.1 hypothetical protein DDB_G0288657 [Dictyostelium discoideum AX4]|eukprot:XP_636607.1 hypothetical protein DDB_G0288657 [Dictyostelium discoideum AX4]
MMQRVAKLSVQTASRVSFKTCTNNFSAATATKSTSSGSVPSFFTESTSTPLNQSKTNTSTLNKSSKLNNNLIDNIMYVYFIY